jgi:hypothetical protein
MNTDADLYYNFNQWGYQHEFLKSDAVLLTAMGYRDNSWGNDVCPNMMLMSGTEWDDSDKSEALCIKIWIDYPNPGDREMENLRYYVTIHKQRDDCWAGRWRLDFQTDDFTAAVAKITEWEKEYGFL